MPRSKRALVLGMDGLDPGILGKLMAEGKLPAFSSLSSTGVFRPLTTSNPAQSPVAWSTIATGSNPGHHGIFDFLTRTPGSYLPVHSIVKVNPKNTMRRRESTFVPVRKGTAFWDVTSRAGIPTTVLRWPVTFPPEQVSGHLLSGLGVLDLRGSAGRYSFYTTAPTAPGTDMKGDVIMVPRSAGRARTAVQGPDKSRVPFEIAVDSDAGAVILTIDGRDRALKVGEWSDWISLRFNVGPLKRVWGTCRFYLDAVTPDLRLYLSPIHPDPAKPAFPITYPDDYAGDLAREIGTYGTLGIPEDTNALGDGCYSDEAFLTSCDSVMAERERMLWHELERFDEGLLAFVFDTTDRIQHIYWRTRDPEHPAYEEGHAARYGNVVEGYYRRMDRILGRVLESTDEQDLVCVVSDHGFTSFRRAVHLNSWLVENGLMVLRKPSRDDEGEPLFKNVVWEKTRAYAMGFTSVFLNLRGREARGIVRPGEEADQMTGKIAGILASLKDPKTGSHVIRNVYRRDDIYSGACAGEAPELVAGFEPGYRASWQTAIGGAPPRILEDNTKAWSGDHFVDAPCVPGIFLMNRPVSADRPDARDIGPTVLDYLGVPPAADMEGRSLLEPQP